MGKRAKWGAKETLSRSGNFYLTFPLPCRTAAMS